MRPTSDAWGSDPEAGDCSEDHDAGVLPSEAPAQGSSSELPRRKLNSLGSQEEGSLKTDQSCSFPGSHRATHRSLKQKIQVASGGLGWLLNV